jgi:TIR domain
VSDSIDFFISYTASDVAWAEWIAWTLERDGGYSVCFQLWDFAPGTNFPLKMQDAAARSEHTIMVLSPAYLKANFPGPEWAAAFARDPQGIDRRLIPVMIEECEPDGVLAPIVSIRLVGRDEATARETLLRGLSRELRPSRPPAFPGAAPAARPGKAAPRPQVPPVFPASSMSPTSSASPAPPDKRDKTLADQGRTDAVPWTPLTADLAVPWEPARSRAGGDRLELHLLPVTRTPIPDLRRLALGQLVDAGRQAGIFPAAATVSTLGTQEQVAALLADAAGLRVTVNGVRSGWLTLPAAPAARESATPPGVADAITRLVAATASLRAALPDRVAFAVAISRAHGTTRTLQPRTWLPSRYLTSHVQQVAAELGERFLGHAT